MITITNQSLLLGSLGSAVLGWLMFLLSVFLILLILVQRGKGGGLAGALGGPGGQSAFGSKAGDTFTLITAVSAIIWGFICAIAMYTLGVPPLTADDATFEIDDTPAITSPAGEDAGNGLSGMSDLLSGGLGADPATDESETSEAGEDASDGEGDAAGGEAETSAEGESESSEGTPSQELTPAESTESDSSGDDAAGSETAGDE